MPSSSYDPTQPMETLIDFDAGTFFATQLNDPTLNGNRQGGAPKILDLSDMIADIIIESSVQGASFLEVHLIDPYQILTTRFGHQSAFFDVDDGGLLWPVDVNYPQGTDRFWRLASLDVSGATDGPNITATFEDRIATEMRDVGGPLTSGLGESRAQFIHRVVRLAAKDAAFVCPALGNQPAGSDNPIVTPPKSATQPKAPTARRNPLKKPGIARGSQGATLTPNGVRYTRPINGLSVAELNALNPPTNVPDVTGTDPAKTGTPFGGFQP